VYGRGAPGKIERPAQDHVKTDRRNAERLVRLLTVDGLHPVRVLSGEEEALRDLVGAREDVLRSCRAGSRCWTTSARSMR
jgi:transposase